MDPITHGVIGLAISAFSGDSVSLSSPVSIGCAIGAMSPDIDVVIRVFKDEYHYLKHHRGFSHSVPALIGLSSIITLGLSLFYTNFSFLNVFLWTFIGALSHTLFDILNSYGAKLLSPFTEKKFKADLLMLYDPPISILALLLIFNRNNSMLFLGSIATTFIAYIGLRYLMRKRAKNLIMDNFKNDYELTEINVLPAITAFHKWDFVFSSDSHNTVGQVNILNGNISIRKEFQKPNEEIVELFNNTNVGKYFSDFSPVFHVVKIEDRGRIVLKSIDLRYYFRNNFMHHATAIFDKDQNIIESFFHPYKIDKYIYVPENIEQTVNA